MRVRVRVRVGVGLGEATLHAAPRALEAERVHVVLQLAQLDRAWRCEGDMSEM